MNSLRRELTIDMDEWVNKINCGHAIEVMRRMPDGCVDSIITSPPYWGLRDYKTEPLIWDDPGNCEHRWGEELPEHHPGQVEQTKWPAAEAAGVGQTAKSGRFCAACGAWLGSLGQEPNIDLFVSHLCQIFNEARRVLRPMGTLWIVISDTYSGSGGAGGDYRPGGLKDGQPKYRQGKSGLPSKSLCMVPARFAIAMIDAGWILRSEIIWAKSVSLSETDSGNCMPESVSDRPTGSHEKIFMFAKEGKYYYDQDAVREPLRDSSIKRINQPTFDRQTGGEKDYSQGENPNMSARKALESFASKHRQPNPEDPRITHGSYKNGHSGYFNSDGDLLANPNGRNLRNVWRANEVLYKLRDDLDEATKMKVISQLIERGLL